MFDNPLCSEMDSILSNCFRDCHNNFFHKFKYECIYDIGYKNIVKNEMIIFAVSGKNMDLYDLNNKLKVARENGFIFILINKLTKIYSPLGYIKISYYLKFPIPILHRQFIKTISQNKQYVEIFFNDKCNPFHFAGQKWLNHLN